MKALLNRRSIFIFVIAILIAVSTIVSINVWGRNGPVTGLANAVSRPLRSLASTVVRVFESIYSSIYRYDDLMADYEKKLIRLSELEAAYRDSIIIAEENKRLREVLGFRERHSGYDAVDAFVVDRSGDNWSSSFTINLGYMNSDIKRGNGVITEYGMLIGQISDVGATSSTVSTVLDTTFSVSAFIGDGGGRATVKGDFTLMRSGLLMLDYIKEDIVVLPGDFIVTSGDGGMLPAGLIVGEVLEVYRHSTGIGRYATVKPMRDVTTISHVFIITGFELWNPDQGLEQGLEQSQGQGAEQEQGQGAD